VHAKRLAVISNREVKSRGNYREVDRMGTPEPDPVPRESKAIGDLVIEDMRERDRYGSEDCGTPLQSGNRQDPLVDAYQEALGLAVNLGQAIEESSSGD